MLSFNSHAAYYPTNVVVNFNFIFGSMIFSSLLLQIISGIALAIFYSPHHSIAFLTVIFIMIDVNFGWFIRFLHMNGASFFMLFLYFHYLRSLWYYSYFRSSVWFSGSFLFLLSVCEAFLGYILIWGQMSYWAMTVIINIFTVFPYLGSSIVDWIYSSSCLMLQRLFVVHFIFGFLLLIFSLLHILLLHTISSINPLFSLFTLSISSTRQFYFSSSSIAYCSSQSYLIFFFPMIILKDLFLGSINLFVFLIFLLMPFIFCSCDNSIEANSLITPIHIVPEWYFLFFYSILRSFPNKLLGILSIFSFLFLLFITPTFHCYYAFSSRIKFNWGLHSNRGMRLFDDLLIYFRFSLFSTFHTIPKVIGFYFMCCVSFLLFHFGGFNVEEFYLSINRLLLQLIFIFLLFLSILNPLHFRYILNSILPLTIFSFSLSS